MKNEIITRYKNKESAKEIAESLGCHWSLIYYHIRNENIPTHNMVNSSKKIINRFSDLTHSSEYWLGFLLADGYIKENSGNRQQAVRLRLVDREHVEKFADFLNFKGIISEEKNGSYTAQINNQLLVDTIKNYGIVERKSNIAEVDSRLKNSAHFWRGYFDGDGWISKNKGRYIMGIVGTGNVCKSFERYTQNFNLRFTTKVRRVKGEVWEVRVHSQKSTKIILENLYKYSSEETRLSRKYSQFQEII